MKTLRICGSEFKEIPIEISNSLGENPNTINIGSNKNLPTSFLTYDYLRYFCRILGLRGYDQESGMEKGQRCLLTQTFTWEDYILQNPAAKQFIESSIIPKFNEFDSVYELISNGVLKKVDSKTTRKPAILYALSVFSHPSGDDDLNIPILHLFNFNFK
jgi:hypothetical protein